MFTILIRTALTAFVLSALTACGSSGPPTDAEKGAFCEAAANLRDAYSDAEDMSDMGREQMGPVRDTAKKVSQIGTPENIPDSARRGFEAILVAAEDSESYEGMRAEIELDKNREATEEFNSYRTSAC